MSTLCAGLVSETRVRWQSHPTAQSRTSSSSRKWEGVALQSHTSEAFAAQSMGTWRLVHLSKDESAPGIAFEVDDTSLDHLMECPHACAHP
jgi:hypothetical protein